MSNDTRSSRILMFLLGALAGSAAAYLVQAGTDWLPSREPLAPDAAQPYAAKVVSAQSPEAYQVAQRLKQGGLIVYFRHAQRQKWDSVIAFDVFEAATGVDSSTSSFVDAVCLTPQGREEAKMIGEIFALAKAPVGRVVASPICRARQTASLAFGRIDQLDAALIHTPVVNIENAESFARGLQRLLETVPLELARNTVIVAHGNTLNNHPGLFASGQEFLGEPLMETGFYVIERTPDRKLRILHKYVNLGDFAANAIDLDPQRPPAP